MILKKIGVLSLGYAVAIFGAIMTFVQISSLVLQTKNPLVAETIDPNVVSMMNQYGLWAILLSPLLGLLMGFIGGVITAAIYNFIVVKITGGIKLELSETKKK